MASTTASVGKRTCVEAARVISKDQISESIGSPTGLEKKDYRGYVTFDGLRRTIFAQWPSKLSFCERCSNTLEASLLARAYSYTRKESYRVLAQKAVQYTAGHQSADSSWHYGEQANMHWVDNFRTAYVLDSFKYYIEATGDGCFEANLARGCEYWKNAFFLTDGTPRYYDHKTLPIDIQCSSQAIDTLVFSNDRNPGSLSLALKVAKWTIDNMQDRTGYFYYRRYLPYLVNKTPTLHRGQATMLCALAGLYQLL